MLRTSLILLLLTLSGCALWPQPKTETIYVTQPHECGTPPAVDVITMSKVEWLIDDGKLCLLPRGYENLSVNMGKVKQAIQQKNALINFYVRCVKDSAADAGR